MNIADEPNYREGRVFYATEVNGDMFYLGEYTKQGYLNLHAETGVAVYECTQFESGTVVEKLA